MTYEEFEEGFEILRVGTPRFSFKRDIWEDLFEQHFKEKNGRVFIRACKDLVKTIDKTIYIADIFKQMKSYITYEYEEEQQYESCGKCENGLIFLKR